VGSLSIGGGHVRRFFARLDELCFIPSQICMALFLLLNLWRSSRATGGSTLPNQGTEAMLCGEILQVTTLRS
jgi:hypothetical protein